MVDNPPLGTASVQTSHGALRPTATQCQPPSCREIPAQRVHQVRRVANKHDLGAWCHLAGSVDQRLEDGRVRRRTSDLKRDDEAIPFLALQLCFRPLQAIVEVLRVDLEGLDVEAGFGCVGQELAYFGHDLLGVDAHGGVVRWCGIAAEGGGEDGLARSGHAVDVWLLGLSDREADGDRGEVGKGNRRLVLMNKSLESSVVAGENSALLIGSSHSLRPLLTRRHTATRLSMWPIRQELRLHSGAMLSIDGTTGSRSVR